MGFKQRLRAFSRLHGSFWFTSTFSSHKSLDISATARTYTLWGPMTTTYWNSIEYKADVSSPLKHFLSILVFWAKNSSSFQLKFNCSLLFFFTFPSNKSFRFFPFYDQYVLNDVNTYFRGMFSSVSSLNILKHFLQLSAENYNLTNNILTYESYLLTGNKVLYCQRRCISAVYVNQGIFLISPNIIFISSSSILFIFRHSGLP